MMKIIIPHCVVSDAAQLRKANEASVIPIALGNQVHATVQIPSCFMDLFRKFSQECPCGGIRNRVYSVEAKSINMKVRHPLQCIFDEVAANLVARRAVEIDSLTPRRLVAVRKVGTETR